MRKLLLILLAILSTGTLKGNDHEAVRRIEKWISSEVVGQKVTEYLSTYDLSRYIQYEKQYINVRWAAPIIEDCDYLTTFVNVIFQNRASDTQAIFVTTCEKRTREINVELCFLSKGDPMSPELFFDILTFPGFIVCYPEALRLYSEEDANIYISTEFNKDGSKFQTWTFFTPYEQREAFVMLMPDGEGGTYFGIHDPNQ